PRPLLLLRALTSDSPLRIHNRSVEEYQRIYHEVVDEMLTYLQERSHSSIQLRARASHKTKAVGKTEPPHSCVTSADENGLLSFNMSYGVGVSPPHYDVDISGEPKPKNPPQKRAKH
ncbi:hypothetical protein L3Q82_014891, partial [Scortum barcoo]